MKQKTQQKNFYRLIREFEKKYPVIISTDWWDGWGYATVMLREDLTQTFQFSACFDLLDKEWKFFDGDGRKYNITLTTIFVQILGEKND